MSYEILPADDLDTTYYVGQCTNSECKTQIKFLYNYAEYEDSYKFGFYFRIVCPMCNVKFNCPKQKCL